MLVDEFKIRRLPAEARPVVNELEVNLMASVLDERHRVVAHPVAFWGAEVKAYTWRARAQSFAFWLVSTGLVLVAGCGGATPRESSLVYADLQLAEARLERAAMSLETCAQEAVDEARAAAAEACGYAVELAETDIRIRCERAEERAQMMHTEFEAQCAESQADGVD